MAGTRSVGSLSKRWVAPLAVGVPGPQSVSRCVLLRAALSGRWRRECGHCGRGDSTRKGRGTQEKRPRFGLLALAPASGEGGSGRGLGPGWNAFTGRGLVSSGWGHSWRSLARSAGEGGEGGRTRLLCSPALPETALTPHTTRASLSMGRVFPHVTHGFLPHDTRFSHVTHLVHTAQCSFPHGTGFPPHAACVFLCGRPVLFSCASSSHM